MNDLNDYKGHLHLMSMGADQDFANAANFLLQIIGAVENNMMSTAEAAESMRDIQRQLDVIQAAERLETKEQLNTLINGLIALAGAV
jgi:hypothetical protein